MTELPVTFSVYVFVPIIKCSNALAVCDKNHKMRRLARTTFSIAGKHEMVHGAQCRNDCNGEWFSLLKWN